jgi:hypothetical protein
MKINAKERGGELAHATRQPATICGCRINAQQW